MDFGAAHRWRGHCHFRQRKKLFGYKKEEGDTYASANLRMIMVVLFWIHAVLITALLIYEV